MKHTSDVILIGGGVTGLSTAVHLKLQGVERVTILERHHIGAGQSHRAAGELRDGALARRDLQARLGRRLRTNPENPRRSQVRHGDP